MVDCFQGLGHYTVVGRYHQYGDIGYPGAPGADCGKCLVTWCVQECNRLALVFNLIGADMLRNAAYFLSGDPSPSDGIQQGSLPVIHMAENSYHRGPGLEVGLSLRHGLRGRWASRYRGGLGDGGPDAKRGGYQGCYLVIDDLVHRRHNTVAHQLFDDVDRVLVDEFSQPLDGHSLGQQNSPGLSPASFPRLSSRPGRTRLFVNGDWSSVRSHFLSSEETPGAESRKKSHSRSRSWAEKAALRLRSSLPFAMPRSQHARDQHK